MLTITPKLLARITHFPRTPTLYPETALFFCNGNPAIRIQTSKYAISLHKIVYLISFSLGFRFAFKDCQVGLIFLRAIAIMDKIEAYYAISTATDITLDIIFFPWGIFIEG